jgi:alpha-L-rhamnosidase
MMLVFCGTTHHFPVLALKSRMKTGITLSGLMLVIIGTTFVQAAIVEDPRCEYLKNPLGIDVSRPRLSWILTSDQRGARQGAYKVLVASSIERLSHDLGDLWDSGQVSSDQSIQVEYDGKPLASRTVCFWKVRVWDGSGHVLPWSQTASWTMGLLKPDDWQAKWIGDDALLEQGPLAGAQWIWFNEGNPIISAPLGTRYFRRTIALPPGRKLVRATCVITADDAFELSINGQKAGQGNNYEQFITLDVTALLRAGENILAISATNVGVAPNPAGLIAKLHVEFAEAAPLDLATDGEWEASADQNQWEAAKALGEYGIAPWGKVSGHGRVLPARYLRREFPAAKQVARATAYVCGLGFFDLFLNGEKVSDDVMDPALSDYTKALYYVTFDVTKQLHLGANALGVILGNGRYFAPRASSRIATFGYPKLLLQLEVEYADGTKTTVVSDENWRLTTNGPIRANNEYDGEEYDARLEMPGWDRAGFDDSTWDRAQLVAAPGGVLRAQMIEPMRVTETIHPVGITNPAPGIYIVDMGQNFYGTVRLSANGPRGAQVRLTSAYSLKHDGTLKTADNRSARSTDVYTFKGQGTEVWHPRFKGQGYRRVQVSDFPGTPTVDNFEGLVIHTEAEPAGEFECSNDLVNRIHTAMRWSMRMFLRSAPLDPDRDERQAWTGDPAKDAESEAFNFNVAPFYTKWMDDVRQSQRADGSLPDVAMYWAGGDGVEWPSVFTIIPDWFTEFYADGRVAETNYAAMKAWVLAMRRHELADGTLKATSFGDWCDAYSMDRKASERGATPRELVSSAYQYHNCRILERLAGRFGHEADQRLFADMAGKLKTAFNQKFLDPKAHIYQGGTQCGYILPLAFGLVPAGQRDGVIANLIDDIMVKHNGHLSVGLIGMQWLMQTLTDIGQPEVAWTIVTQTTRPSWGYMLSKGATTIWERWDTDTRDLGMNSEALLIQAGNLDAWFYQTLAGIRPAAPGFKKILIQPSIVGDLTWVKAHFDSPYGRILSSWKRDGSKLDLDITIPANTTATVVVPGKGGGAREVGPGRYQFQSELTAHTD